MQPYRGSRVETPKLTAEAGIVDDMVRQFADPYAFLRELVQNGIDAGATAIEVRVERAVDGAVVTSVADDGCGMSRAIIEGPLLTLFESSKESDATKIGKYGIGFVSVFALAPERVEVRTRTAAESWLVRLFGDHSFELEEGTIRPGTGSEVTLVQTMTVEDFASHARLTKEGLFHWCRHAHVPITLSIVDGEGGGETTTVNMPLSVQAAASVTIVEGDERFVVGLGDPAAGRSEDIERQPSFCGLYNRGLTLLQTIDAEPGLDWIRFKIDSPKLGHTLSRDNVRRDREHRRLLKRVHEIVTGPLIEELYRQLAQAAEEAASGGCERYAALLEAALAPTIRERTETVPVPLASPIHGRSTMPLDAVLRARSPIGRKMLLVAEESEPLTLALAGVGRPVIRHLALAPLLRRLTPLPVLVAGHGCAFVAAIETSAEDAALCAELARLLEAADRAVAAVRLAAFTGVLQGAILRLIACEDRATAASALTGLSTVDGAGQVQWGSARALFLNADHDLVRLARRHAKSDRALAAQLLVRALLLAEGPLEKHVVDDLLDAAVGRERDV